MKTLIAALILGTSVLGVQNAPKVAHSAILDCGPDCSNKPTYGCYGYWTWVLGQYRFIWDCSGGR